jgi:hypothetical protein
LNSLPSDWGVWLSQSQNGSCSWQSLRRVHGAQLDDETEKILQEIRKAILAESGVDATDSQIIRAALRHYAATKLKK